MTQECREPAEEPATGPKPGFERRVYLWLEGKACRLYDRAEASVTARGPGWYRRWFSALPHPTWRDILAVFVVSFLLVTFTLRHVVFSTQYYWGSGTDIASQHYPARDFSFYWMKKGVLPLWNPYIFNGLPVQTGVKPLVYPANLLGLMVKEVGRELGLTFWLHMSLGAAFMAGFMVWLGYSRAAGLLAGLMFGIGGFNVAHMFAGHIDVITTTAWCPLILWLTQVALRYRGLGWTLLAGVGMAVMVMAAHYHVIYLTLWTAGGVSLITCLLGSRYGVAPWRWRPFFSRDVVDRAPQPELTYDLLSAGVGVGARASDISWWLARFLLLGVLGLALTAFQVMPTWESLQMTNRANVGFEFASAYGAPSLAWLTYLFPHFHEMSVQSIEWANWIGWEGQAYVGIVGLMMVVLALATTGRRCWLPLLVVFGLASLIGMGTSTPIYKLYYAIDPMVSKFRVPSRFMLCSGLVACWMAALGFQAVLDRPGALRRRITSVCWLFVGGLGLLWLAMFMTTGPGPDSLWGRFVHLASSEERWNEIVHMSFADGLNRLLVSTWLRVTWALLLAGVTAYLLLRARPRQGAVGIVLLLLLDLNLFARPYLETAPPEKFWLPKPVLEFFGQDPFTQRVMTDAELDWQNRFAAYEVAEIGGYEAFANQIYTEAVNLAIGRPREEMFTRLQIFDKMPLFDIQGARYYFSHALLSELEGVDQQARMSKFKLVLNVKEGAKIYENSEAFPRAWVVFGAEGADTEEEVLPRVVGRADRLRLNVMLGPVEFTRLQAELQARHWKMDPVPPNSPVPTDTARLNGLTIRPNDVSMHAELAKPGMIVLSDAWWPGWKVTVDGQPAELWQANGKLHRGVLVPEGSHDVVFYYWPDKLSQGIRISLVAWGLTLLLMVGGWFLGRRK